MNDVAKFLGAFIWVLISVSALLAILGWIVSVCVTAVFDIDFTLWQGVATVVLSNILLRTEVPSVGTRNN